MKNHINKSNQYNTIPIVEEKIRRFAACRQGRVKVVRYIG
jgi:hypothetical protein